ncbi:MAG: histidine--tRNA ligase [Reichenbachiella sp.]
MQKPSIPRGTRDFGPKQMAKRNFIFNTIRSVFQKFGFSQLETPTMENLSVLTGKYGDEGDQLVFKILNSGDYLSKTSIENFNAGSKKFLPTVSEKGLRYDLTVPFARYVVMNQHDLSFPFKRFQIQPVWRADRPQKGRYREFYQCDADVVGTDSLLCEAEIVVMLNEVFEKLKLQDFAIKINNRKILQGFTEVIGQKGKESEFCVAIDKLDKIGKDKVFEELQAQGFDIKSLDQINPIFETDNDLNKKLSFLETLFHENEIGKKGISEIKEMLNKLESFDLANTHLDLDLSLARGLSYYTGMIFEVKATTVNIGSISGGGRYDNLTGVFGLKDVSGVGISFGVDRIYDVLETLELFPESNASDLKVMIVNFGEDTSVPMIKLLSELRANGINAEAYPDSVKMKKQFNYANKRGVPFVIILGQEEIESNTFVLKDMIKGEQTSHKLAELISKINNSQ